MTERHYAHLAPNYVAETVRAALPGLGIVERTSAAPLGGNIEARWQDVYHVP
jgi:hypothetical protein